MGGGGPECHLQPLGTIITPTWPITFLKSQFTYNEPIARPGGGGVGHASYCQVDPFPTSLGDRGQNRAKMLLLGHSRPPTLGVRGDEVFFSSPCVQMLI